MSKKILYIDMDGVIADFDLAIKEICPELETSDNYPDTVVLSIDSYNELRDFRKGIEEGNTLYISYGFCSYEKKYITTDEAVKNILSINKALEAQINEFRINEFQISKIKKMSIWEFIKWRKS